jgi:hypothetical protein
MQRGINHAEQSNDENDRKSARKKNYVKENKSCGTKEQRKRPKISKGTKSCTREQICETTEQTNEGNIRFFV